METIYFAGGCLWGVQYFVKRLPGVISTEAGRVNGNRGTLGGPYDGYAECVKTVFDPEKVSLEKLLEWFFEIIDPFSIDHQGMDYGHKYRTGVYSQNPGLDRSAVGFAADPGGGSAFDLIYSQCAGASGPAGPLPPGLAALLHTQGAHGQAEKGLRKKTQHRE